MHLIPIQLNLHQAWTWVCTVFLSAHGSAGMLPGVFQVLGACWDGMGSRRDGDDAGE